MGDLEIKLSGGSKTIKPVMISGLSFSPDNVATPQKLTTCLGVAGAQQLCVGMGGSWNGQCSLPQAGGSEPLGVAQTCVALGGVFTEPSGPCVFGSSTSSSTTKPGTVVAHCESYQLSPTAPAGAWPSYCLANFEWCNGTGASLPNNCPTGSTLSNYSKVSRGNCPMGSYITKFDCIAN